MKRRGNKLTLDLTKLNLHPDGLAETYQRNAALILRHLTHLMYAATQSDQAKTNANDCYEINPVNLYKELLNITDSDLVELAPADRAVLCAIYCGYSSQIYDQTFSYVSGAEVELSEFDVEYSDLDLFDFVSTAYKFKDKVKFKNTLERIQNNGIILYTKKFGNQAGTSFVKTVQLDPQFMDDFFNKHYIRPMKKTAEVNHYKYIDEHFATFLEKLGLNPDLAAGAGAAHGDKCYQYRDTWEKWGISFEKGCCIYLLTYYAPFSTTVRDTPKGWVDPSHWVIANRNKFMFLLP